MSEYHTCLDTLKQTQSLLNKIVTQENSDEITKLKSLNSINAVVKKQGKCVNLSIKLINLIFKNINRTPYFYNK